MNALKQYIDLFEENKDTIEGHCPAALNAPRAHALRLLKDVGRLPDCGDEGYEKTSVNDMFATDFGVNINRVNLPVDLATSFRCGVPNMSTLLAIVANDRFVPTNTLLSNMPQGITVMSLNKAAREYPDIIEKHYGSVAPADNTLVALNSLLVQDGVFIHIKKGIHLDKPIQLVNLFAAPAPLMAVRRILVVAEEGSSIAIIKCDHTQHNSDKCLSSEVIELSAAADARIQWYDMEESDAATSRMCQIFVDQKSNSDVTICSATLTNGVTRNEFSIGCTGPHTNTSLYGMAIGSRAQHIDNDSDIRHAADHGHSRQLFKYVLDEEATGAFEGSIEVCHGARFVEAYQNNRNILGSTLARMHAKPQLLIYNDDVKCSHGSATGQLDDKALFYMQTRGIPLSDARKMLMQAFMSDVIDNIELEPLRDRMRHMVERRFAGEHVTCQECSNH